MGKVKKRVDKCISVLQVSKSFKERKAAVRELCDIGFSAEKALPELMKIINGNDDFVIQGLAEETVIKIGEPAIPFIKKLLRSLYWKKRSKGIEILGAIALADKESVSKVLPLVIPATLRDMNYRVRLDAVTLIGKLAVKNKKLSDVIELLGEVLRTDRNQLIQREASESLAKVGSDLAIKEIINSIKRENYPLLRPTGIVRYEAANGLYSVVSDNPKKIKYAIPDLLKILRKDPAPAVRISVITPLMLAGGWDVIDDILESAANDRWYQVRRTALSTIGLLIQMKPSKKKIRSIEPIIKKIAREDKQEFIQDAAKDLLEGIEEIIKKE